MLKESVLKLINRQIERESYSSHLYLSMAAWSENQGLEGTSKWLYAQSDEERLHLLKFIGYINERGGKAVVSGMEQPPVEFTSVKKLFEQVLEHEVFISESINELAYQAMQEKDLTTYNYMQWFITEQLEEEKSVKAILDKINLIGDGNLYVFDKDVFGLRTPATTTSAT